MTLLLDHRNYDEEDAGDEDEEKRTREEARTVISVSFPSSMKRICCATPYSKKKSAVLPAIERSLRDFPGRFDKLEREHDSKCSHAAGPLTQRSIIGQFGKWWGEIWSSQSRSKA